MGLYYNRTGTPQPVTLLGGGSILIRSRTHEEVCGMNESSPALLAALAKGHLVKLPDSVKAKMEAASTEVVSSSLEPVVLEAVPAVAAVVVEPSADVPADSIASAGLIQEVSVGDLVSAETPARTDVPRRRRS